MYKTLLFILTTAFVLCDNSASAQVDTLRGRVPYWHYNFYDSTWCQTNISSSGICYFYCPGNAIVNKVGIPRTDYHPNDTSVSGHESCLYFHESPEVAVRMDMDSIANISGLVFGYNPTYYTLFHSGGGDDNNSLLSFKVNPYDYPIDYVFNIYDDGMGLIWSDTVDADSLKVDYYMEAGFDWNNYHEEAYHRYYSSGQGGYYGPFYMGLCKIAFDTIISVPATFYIGITSPSPISTTDDSMLIVTALYETSWKYTPGSTMATAMQYETRRYRVSQSSGEAIQDWADEECHYGVQTCLYPILVLPCSEVTNLRYEPVGSTGTIAFVQWDGDANHAGYEISYGPQGTPPGEGTVRQVVNHQAVLSQLDRSTRYDVYVRARCDYDTTRWSAWSDTLHMHIATYGIDDVEAPEVTLAPNPTDGRLAVRCEAPITAVALYDLQGRAVLTASGSGTEAVLDLAALPKGTYVAMVSTALGQTARTVEKR